MNYIFKTLILVSIIVVFMYIFMFRRRRRKKDNDFNSVKEYHEAFERHRLSGRNNKRTGNTYITKYNSTEDYREKNDIFDKDI